MHRYTGDSVMRSIRVIAVGISKSSNRPWIKGVADANADEQLAALKLGVDPKGALFGFIRGLPDAAAARLTHGDTLTGEFVAKISPTSYESDGEVKLALDVTFFASGNISRTPAATAVCDW
jgi:hypothetical protein